MSAPLTAFLNAFTEADLLEMFPEGNKTAAAAYVRYRAYIGSATTPKGMIDDIIRVRQDADFAPGVGHKRGALIVAIAVCVKAVSHKAARDLTDNMKKMINESFDQDFIEEFVRLLTGANTSHIQWGKDGVVKKLAVTKEAADNVALNSWCNVAWAPIRA